MIFERNVEGYIANYQYTTENRKLMKHNTVIIAPRKDGE